MLSVPFQWLNFIHYKSITSLLWNYFFIFIYLFTIKNYFELHLIHRDLIILMTKTKIWLFDCCVIRKYKVVDILDGRLILAQNIDTLEKVVFKVLQKSAGRSYSTSEYSHV